LFSNDNYGEGKMKEQLMKHGLDTEKGMKNGGWYTPDELVEEVRKYDLEDVTSQLIYPIKWCIDENRTHELIHCFDVGLGAAELVKQVSQDSKANEKLGIPQLTPDYTKSAFLSGLFHDMILGFKGKEIERAITEKDLIKIVEKKEVSKFQGKAQYIKDVIGDDLRGAILLDKAMWLRGFDRDLFSGQDTYVGGTAVHSLFNGSNLEVNSNLRLARKCILGEFGSYKILDAIWYHDGNYPIRGYAEADAIVGDRIKLFQEGQVEIDVVEAGIKKLMTYTEQDPEWAERSKKTDAEYLTKIIDKKVGPFMQAISGTPTYDFVVDSLAARRRGHKTLKSPAFWMGVDKMSDVIDQLREVKELKDRFGPEIDLLDQRYEEIQQYKGE